MKLIFEWIEKIDKRKLNGEFLDIDQGINFSDEYYVNYDKNNNTLHIKKNDDYFLDGFFNIKGTSVEQVSCLVGTNGSGKTTILKHLFKTDCSTFHDDYTKENCPFWRTIQVIEYDGHLKIYYNIENLVIDTELKHEKYACINLPLPEPVRKAIFEGDYHNTSKVFLTNDYYGYINQSLSQTAVEKVAFTPYDMGIRKSQFYDICALKENRMVYLDDWFYRYNDILLRSKRADQLQSVFDLLLLRQIKLLHKEDAFNYIKNFKLHGSTIIDIENLKDPKLKFPRVAWKKLRSDIILHRSKCLEEIQKQNKVNFAVNGYGYNEIITYMMIDCVAELNSLNINDVHNFPILTSLYFFWEVELRMAMLDLNGGIFENKKSTPNELLDAFKNGLKDECANNKDLEKEYIERKTAEYEYFIYALNSIIELEKVISENNGSDVFESENADNFLQFLYNQVISKQSFVLKHLYVSGLTYSAGERAFLNIFSWVNASNYLNGIFPNVRQSLNKHVLLLLDEPDLYCHPAWQKRMLKELIDMCNLILPDKKIHLIYSTHSPISLSDMPKSNVIRIEEGWRIRNGEEFDETFGANIFDLFKDNYFLEDFIGDFAQEKINGAISVISNLYKAIISGENPRSVIEERGKNKYSESKKIVSLIGEPLLRNKLDKIIEIIDRYEYRG